MDQGRDLLKSIEVLQKGKPIEGEPVKGAYTIRMKPGQTYWGFKDAALKELAKSFPGCTFEWGEEKNQKSEVRGQKSAGIAAL